MGGRYIKAEDEAEIVDDWPVKAPVGRERRKAQYRADRAAARAQRAPEKPYPGWMRPQDMFPDWDWENEPLGPPLDDPLVKAFTEIQWKAFRKSAR